MKWKNGGGGERGGGGKEKGCIVYQWPLVMLDGTFRGDL